MAASDTAIARAGPDDMPSLGPMVAAFHETQGIATGAAHQAALARLLADQTLGWVWLIRAEGALAGYIIVCPSFSLEFAGRIATLDEIYLLEAFRGRGIGRAALALLSAELDGTDLRALFLEVDENDIPLQRLYTGQGFIRRSHYISMLRTAPDGR